MVIVCRRCFRRAQIATPPIGERLRCTQCGQRQLFGTERRRRREIAGVVRFAERRAPSLVPDQAPFDDDVADLFKAG